MKGRTWCISFEDVAKKDGDVTIKYTVVDKAGRKITLPGKWEGYKKGDTPDKKATRFFNQLLGPYSKLVKATRAGNTICFQLKDTAPYEDIAGVEVGDESGQNFDIYDAVPAQQEEFPEVVRIGFDGTPVTPDAEVRLGLGHVERLARVPTHADGNPLTLARILEALAATFNEIYQRLGFQAVVENNQVVVPGVPCRLGMRGGSNDEGLRFWVSMADADVAPMRGVFDKLLVLRNSLRLIEARLDLARIPAVAPLDPDVTHFVAVRPDDEPGTGDDTPKCTISIKILVPPPPVRIPAGSKTLTVRVEYSIDRTVSPAEACIINILVEKIAGAPERVVDRRVTARDALSPASGEILEIPADSDMGLVRGNTVRITAIVICKECPPATDGPKLFDVGAGPQ